MGLKFHVNQHGIPTVCNSLLTDCEFDVDLHFKSYEDALSYIERREEEFKRKTPNDEDQLIKRIQGYYDSLSAVNEFPLNREVAKIDDFELIMESWLAKDSIKKDMKRNVIYNIEFTYGDIVRVLSEEMKVMYASKINLEKYYNPIVYDYWEDWMKTQSQKYNDTSKFKKNFQFENVEMIHIPMSARKCLEKDGFIKNSRNIHEVLYKITPSSSKHKNIISFNHSTNEFGEAFDIYELAGAVEGKTLYDLCYHKIEQEFYSMWETSSLANSNIDYTNIVDRYKSKQFYRGLEGADIPKAFVKMSPIVAKGIAEYIKSYRILMFSISEILIEIGAVEKYSLEDEDDGSWFIEMDGD